MEKVNKAGDLLSGLFRQYFDEETLKEARKTAGLYGSWEEITQRVKINAASDHSRIREFEKGVLVIEAEHPGWIQLLQTKQKNILNILQKKYPDMKIQGLCFCLSKASFPGTVDAASSGNATSVVGDASTAVAIEPLANPTNAASETEPSASSPKENKEIKESLEKFKKVIEKRNRRNPHK